MREFLQACYDYIGTIILLGLVIIFVGESLIEAWKKNYD